MSLIVPHKNIAELLNKFESGFLFIDEFMRCTDTLEAFTKSFGALQHFVKKFE